jgi:hypothetical protein
VLLRDLGGFSYEVHRAAARRAAATATSSSARRSAWPTSTTSCASTRPRSGLGGPAATVVRRPGIGGTCPTCGELHGSDAGWCSHCGTPLTDRARRTADEGVTRAIADRETAERERAAAAQAAAAPAPDPVAEEPTDEHKRTR